MAKSNQTDEFKQTRSYDGIEVTVDTRAFEDMRFFRLFTSMSELEDEKDKAEESEDRAASGRIYIKLMDRLDEVAKFVLGDQVERCQDEIAARNDGYLRYTDWLDFVLGIIKDTEKNADARPTGGGK